MNVETKTTAAKNHMDALTVGLCTLTVVGAGTTAAMPFWAQKLGHAPSIGVVVLAAGLAAFLALHTYYWWRDLDEAAREAHKWAWWWGGNIGFIVWAAGFLIAALTSGNLAGATLLPAPIPHTDATLIAAGFIAAFAAQAVGYAIAWCSWWIARQ